MKRLVPPAAIAFLALVALAAPAHAQSEDQLRAYFEGKNVLVLLEMPGAEQGVDVYPGTPQPIDFARHATRLKQFGTAFRRGDVALVTKVKVKKDLIEFQLGGGGYGTSGDDADPNVSVPSVTKSEREKNLERDLKLTTDQAQRRQISEELDGLQRRRQAEDARNQAVAAEASQIKVANIRQRRLEGGSRFNLRYRPVVPPEAMTPPSVMQALAAYLDFSPLNGGQGPVTAMGPTPAAYPGAAPDVNGGLHKGMLAPDVDAMLGRPDAIGQRKEGTLAVSTSTYTTRDRRVVAEFVEGVLVRFTISSP